MTAIERNIPIPTDASKNNLHCKYPFRYMAPGDSFLLKDIADMAKAINAVKTRASQQRVKIVYAQEGENLRVWLTETLKPSSAQGGI